MHRETLAAIGGDVVDVLDQQHVGAAAGARLEVRQQRAVAAGTEQQGAVGETEGAPREVDRQRVGRALLVREAELEGDPQRLFERGTPRGEQSLDGLEVLARDGEMHPAPAS